MRDYTNGALERWRIRLDRGKTLSDSALGVYQRRAGLNELQIFWRENENIEHHVTLWAQHFEMLRRQYAAGGHEPALLLTRVFVMVHRYILPTPHPRHQPDLLINCPNLLINHRAIG